MGNNFTFTLETRFVFGQETRFFFVAILSYLEIVFLVEGAICCFGLELAKFAVWALK